MENALAVIQSLLEGIFGKEGSLLLMEDLHLALDQVDDGNECNVQIQAEE